MAQDQQARAEAAVVTAEEAARDFNAKLGQRAAPGPRTPPVATSFLVVPPKDSESLWHPLCN